MKTKILALLVISSFAFFSCQKSDESMSTDQSDALLKSATITVNDLAVESVSQEANFETDFYAGYEHLLRQLAHFKGGKGNLLAGHGRNLLAGKGHNHYVNGEAPLVSIDTAETGYPITITIDYGDGISTNHGRLIAGTVTIEISGEKNSDGSTRKITFADCVIDSIGINGISTETFNGDNTTIRKTTNISNVTFTLADETVIERVGINVREWLKGLDTPTDRTDDMIQTTGSINVVSSTGDNYSRIITEPLINLGNCRHHVQGIVQYSQNSVVIAELNYGDGTCDNLASMTSGGETIEIELKGKMPKAKLEGHPKGRKGKH
ncbi:MAG: hypothetical protein Q8T04_05190 [Bacteroidota bacterium]|nr:hypothetical protein [Bacteroidota bacterium]